MGDGQVEEYSSRVMHLSALTLCAAMAVILLRRVMGSWNADKTLPPGPKGWPIVGSLYSLGPRTIPACRRFTTLADKYGPVMFFRLGSRPTVIVSNDKMARELLRVHDQTFASRPKLATGKHFGYNYSSVVFSPSGAHFVRMKKIYTHELLSPKKVELLSALRMEEAHILLVDVLRNSGTEANGVVNITSLVFKANLNLMGRIVFSKRLFGESATISAPPREVENFKFFVKSATKLVGLFNIGDYIPALRWLDLQGVEGALLQLKPHQEGLLRPIIQEYRKMSLNLEGGMKQKEDGRVDFIAALVSNDSGLSDENIMAVAIDVMVGGSDSTSTAVEWSITELLRHPDCLQAAQEELDSVVGRDRLVEEADCANLPFLNCIVKETLRLHPPSPLAIPHFSAEECTLGGYRIPANTTAYVNIYAIGRDAATWENPNRFNPTRFKDSKVNVYGHDFNLLPFSSGRRGCPGVHFALPTYKLELANLLHCFKWSPPPGVDFKDIDTKEAVGVVCSRLNPLMASVTPRIPRHVILAK